MHALLAFGFAVLLLLTLAQSQRPLEGKTWTYLRSLFPSWRFFDAVEPGPELELCVEPRQAPPTPWQPALSRPGRPGLFLNAAGNLHLAYQSLLRQFLNELDGVEVSVAPRLATYRMTQGLVEARARALRLVTEGGSYRFRLVANGEVYFESESHPLG